MGGKPTAVRVKGPLSPHVPGFRASLGGWATGLTPCATNCG
jgi:hypothetical protein